MDSINRKMRDGWHTYFVYTEKEARERGFLLIPWRKATPGEWALSDDGYVGKCLRVFQSHKGDRLVSLTYGADWTQSKRPLLYKERAATRNWSSSSKSNWTQRDSRKTRAKNAITAYVAMLLAGQKVDWGALAMIYRPDRPPLAGTVRQDFKKGPFQEMIKQELEKVLLEQGSSPQRTIEMYNEAFKKAAKKDKPNVMVEVADRFSEFWGLKESFAPSGELPDGLGDVTILEGISTDLQLARKSHNGKRD